jgi:hypothetical protein
MKRESLTVEKVTKVTKMWRFRGRKFVVESGVMRQATGQRPRWRRKRAGAAVRMDVRESVLSRPSFGQSTLCAILL